MSDVNKIDEATPYQKMRDLLTGLLNRCFGICGLVIATTSTKIKTATAVDYTINGLNYQKAATDNITITAGAVQAISTFCKYLVSVDAAGTVTTTKGNDGTTAALALLSDLPANNAPLGYFQIATNGSTTFTAGTTALDAAGITDTYVDLGAIITES
jgi:hypothetical protein